MIYVKDVEKLLEKYPDDEVIFPLNSEGKIDEGVVKELPKRSREEKVRYCTLSNKIFGTYILATFSKLSDEELCNQVEFYDLMWDY